MTTVFLILTLFPAGLGLWLLADFLHWELRGTKSAGEIEGFTKKVDKGRHLPVISYVDEKGPQKATAKQIDQMMYLLSRPVRGNVTDIIYMQEEEGKPVNLRIYGYLNAGVGVLLVIPFIIALCSMLERTVAVTQGVFFLVFALIIFGGLVFMKLIQRIY